MGRKSKEPLILEGVEITAVAAEGKALARVDNLVVFVPYAVPGDVADLRVLRKKHSYADAEVARFVKLSPLRAEPFCPHFGVCGGCKWQCLPYAEQVRWKQAQVTDCLTRIAKAELPDCLPILPSPDVTEYRNKLEFGCSDMRWLTREQIASGQEFQGGCIGFHASGAFDKILPIEACRLMPPVNDRLRLALRDYALAHGLSFHNAREHKGLLRGMMIRLSNTGGLMLLLQFCITDDEELRQAHALLEHMRQTFPEITSLLWVNNTKCNDTFADLPVHLHHGSPHIFLEMEGLRFKVGAKSFYQTNTRQALELYKTVRAFASLTGAETVYDLYTGTGTIACFLARDARKVVGIECVPEAVDDARSNCALNGIGNAEFHAGDMKDILSPSFLSAHGHPDVAVTDPPRAGMHPSVVATLLEAAPSRIVYVSCNPATQARDIALMSSAYRVAAVQPVDMFPHTQHVESVVLLTRR